MASGALESAAHTPQGIKEPTRATDGTGHDRLARMTTPEMSSLAPAWSTRREALHVVAHRPHLRATVRISLIVGTILFVINQLDVVLSGHATTSTWVKAAITYVVPFCVSNLGILTATRSQA